MHDLHFVGGEGLYSTLVPTYIIFTKMMSIYKTYKNEDKLK